MMTKHRKTVSMLKLTGIHVTANDIEEGRCLLPNLCMVRVAVERHLRKLDPTVPNHHTKVDAGHIRFNIDGYRYSGDTPKVAKLALIQFDKENKAQKKAERAGLPFESKVKPFSFGFMALRGSKVMPMTRERQVQINEARKRRQAAGQKDRRYTFRQRVVGFA